MGLNFEQILASFVRPLLIYPNALEIKVSEQEEIVDILMLVEEADLGRIIGKGGKTAAALRQLLYSIATRNGKKVALEIKAK